MEVKLRKEPRISMNKLAEWAAEPRSVRRRNIIADQIVERPFKRVTYEEGRRALTRFFVNPASTSEQLTRMAQGLRDQAASNPEMDKQDKTSLYCSARALEAFEMIANEVKGTKAGGRAGWKGAVPADLVRGPGIGPA